MSAPTTNGHQSSNLFTDLTTAVVPAPATTGAGKQHELIPGSVEALAQEVERARGLVELQDEPALQQVLAPRERSAERRVTERIRRAERAERRRAGMAAIASARRERHEFRWIDRARASKERLLNPNRRLAATYRRYVALSTIPPLLIGFGVTFMAATVHDGVVGTDGTWIGYLIEPMASVLLVVSLLVGFTAVQNNRKIPRGLYTLDAGLAASSLVLTVVPWGLRYGWDLGSTIAHTLPSLLVVAAVVVQHLLHSVFRPIFADLYEELQPARLNEQTSDTVVLYERARRAVEDGDLPVSETGVPSRDGIRKKFGVGKVRSQLAGDAFELVQRCLDPR